MNRADKLHDAVLNELEYIGIAEVHMAVLKEQLRELCSLAQYSAELERIKSQRVPSEGK